MYVYLLGDLLITGKFWTQFDFNGVNNYSYYYKKESAQVFFLKKTDEHFPETIFIIDCKCELLNSKEHAAVVLKVYLSFIYHVLPFATTMKR